MNGRGATDEAKFALHHSSRVDRFHLSDCLFGLSHILFERQRGAIEHYQVEAGFGGLASLLD